MAENLKVTRYPDGADIPLVADNLEWANLEDNDTDDAYSYYNNDSTSQYGALYTYAAAKDACPTGWHLPSDAEWKTLEKYLGMNSAEADDTGFRGTTEGAKLKATSGWNSDGNGTDEAGFSALPGGYRNGISGVIKSTGDLSDYWSSTEFNSTTAYFRSMFYDRDDVFRGQKGGKSGGSAVRCLTD